MPINSFCTPAAVRPPRTYGDRGKVIRSRRRVAHITRHQDLGLVVRVVKHLRIGARAAVANSQVTPEGRSRGGRLRGMLETRMNESYEAREA
jgi:hypothetical protein